MSEPNGTFAAAGWAVLKGRSKGLSDLAVISLPLEVKSAGRRLRLAVGLNGQPRLLLPLLPTEKPGAMDCGPAVSLSLEKYSIEGKDVVFLDIGCLEPDLELVFGKLVDAIVARVAAGEPCLRAVTDTLEHFRALLLAPRSKLVDRTQIAGLIGELLVLLKLLENSKSAWKTWEGPNGDRHDFRRGTDSLEVKATLGGQTPTVTIHGLDQLEPPRDGTLHLVHHSLEQVAGGALSVATLGSRALGMADDKTSLGERLSRIGCHDIRAPEWNTVRFERKESRVYRIAEGFPRLTRLELGSGDKPAGVSDVTYRVDLSTAQEFLCSASDVSTLYEKLAG